MAGVHALESFKLAVLNRIIILQKQMDLDNKEKINPNHFPLSESLARY